MRIIEHNTNFKSRQIATWGDKGNQSRLLPSGEQAQFADAALMRGLSDPEWNEDIIEARELLNTLTVRRAGTPIHRLSTVVLNSDAVLCAAAVIATGLAAFVTSAILALPLAPVAVAAGGIMALAVTAMQLMHRAT